MSFVKVEEDIIKLTETAKLNYGDVILLSKIITLSENEDKACFASNASFASLMCTTERNIQRYLEKLKKANVIKTFEKRQGMKTTKRFIYPQFKQINKYITEYDEAHKAHVKSDTCSDEAHDNSGEPHDNIGNSTRQNVYEHTTDLVKPHDNSDTLIIDYKRLEETTREEEANASERVVEVSEVKEDKTNKRLENNEEEFNELELKTLYNIRDDLKKNDRENHSYIQIKARYNLNNSVSKECIAILDKIIHRKEQEKRIDDLFKYNDFSHLVKTEERKQWEDKVLKEKAKKREEEEKQRIKRRFEIKYPTQKLIFDSFYHNDEEVMAYLNQLYDDGVSIDRDDIITDSILKDCNAQACLDYLDYLKGEYKPKDVFSDLW